MIVGLFFSDPILSSRVRVRPKPGLTQPMDSPSFNMLLFTYTRWALKLNETSFVLLPLKPTLLYSKQDCVSNLLDNNSIRINLAVFNLLTFTNHYFNFKFYIFTLSLNLSISSNFYLDVRHLKSNKIKYMSHVVHIQLKMGWNWRGSFNVIIYHMH